MFYHNLFGDLLSLCVVIGTEVICLYADFVFIYIRNGESLLCTEKPLAIIVIEQIIIKRVYLFYPNIKKQQSKCNKFFRRVLNTWTLKILVDHFATSIQ